MLTAEKVYHCGNQKSGGRGHVEYHGDGAATYSERKHKTISSYKKTTQNKEQNFLFLTILTTTQVYIFHLKLVRHAYSVKINTWNFSCKLNLHVKLIHAKIKWN